MLMYMPHIVTVYNSVVETNDMFEETTVLYATVLDGVFVDESKGANVRASGMDNADAVTLYIPLNIAAVDGVTGAERTFARPVEYNAATDKSVLWTLEPGDSCFFVRGRVVDVDDMSFELINKKYDAVYTVSKVDIKDFGTQDMQHFEVGGK